MQNYNIHYAKFNSFNLELWVRFELTCPYSGAGLQIPCNRPSYATRAFEYRLFRHELLNVCYQLIRYSRALPPRSYSRGLGVLCFRCLNPEKRQISSLAQYVHLIAGAGFEPATSRLWAWPADLTANIPRLVTDSLYSSTLDCQ